MRGRVLNDCEMLCWWQFAFYVIRMFLYCCKSDLQSVLLNNISKIMQAPVQLDLMLANW